MSTRARSVQSRFMLRSLRVFLAPIIALTACAPTTSDAIVVRAIPVGDDQPTMAVQWDSFALLHPRSDLLTFDGASSALPSRPHGMVESFVRPAQLLAAVRWPSPVMVYRDARATYATGADGYVLSPVFARGSLRSLGDRFALLDGEPAVAAPVPPVVALDDRGRELWRKTLPAESLYCRTRSLVTPDRTRAVVLSGAFDCATATTMLVWDREGVERARVEFDALDSGPSQIFVESTPAAVRDDLTVAVASAMVADTAVTGSNPVVRTMLSLRVPGERAPRRTMLGDFAPAAIAPLGAARWVLVAQKNSTWIPRTRAVFRNGAAIVLVLDDQGRVEQNIELSRLLGTGNDAVVLAESPRGTSLIAPIGVRGVRPRWLQWSADGTLVRDTTLDMDALALAVEPAPVEPGR